jgi:predicted  nucleic acid-binding Zn-ribbon protein
MAGSTTITPPTPTYDTAAGAALLSERVSKLEEELRSFEGTSGDIAEEIEENLKKGLDAIGSRVTNLETGRDSDANRIASLESGNVTHLESFNSTMERMKYHIERLRTDLQEKASVQALTVMRNAQVTLTKDFDDLGAELKRLKDQLQQLLTQYQQDKANATPRAPTPNQHQHHPQQQQPQMPRSSPHIQNGHMPSPMVNGVSQSPSHGHGPTAQGQAQMTKPLPIQPQIDTLFMVVDQLKRRSDNLTTDELAKVMLNQFEAVWPHAKNYEASLSQVREGCTQLENMVRALKHEKDEDVAKVLGEAESMKGLINDMQGKVEALGRTTKALQKDIGKSSSGGGGARGAVQEAWIDEVRSELRKVETIAKDAHNMATKHGQLLHAIDIREMNGRVDDFGNAIFDLQTKASEMEVFKPEFRAVQAALSALKGEFSTTWGKVHNLEVAAARRQGAAPPS